MRHTIIVLAALLALATAAWAQDAATSNPAATPSVSGSDQQAITVDQQTGTATQSQVQSEPQSAIADQAPTEPTDPSASPSDGSMPRTASNLPLVAIGGLIALATGFWVLRDRRRA